MTVNTTAQPEPVLLNTLRMKITGMDCAGCARSIETAISKMDGVEQAELNFTTETLHVSGTPAKADVVDIVQRLGFDIAPEKTASEKSTSEQNAAIPQAIAPPQNFWSYLWNRPATRLTLIAALLVLPGLILTEILSYQHQSINLLSIAAMLLAGGPIARSALREFTVSRTIGINALMVVAAIGALFIGVYVEAAMVVVLFSIGEALEGYTATRARNSIRSLMQVAPNTALLIHDDHHHKVDINKLKVGDVILVRPGERIPMDGTIQMGHSSVNQAAITGESRLIEKSVGDELFAGTINGEGALHITITHLAQDNTIARMIRMVEEAQERRSPAQRFIDKFATRYTPAVMLLALAVMVIPPLFFGQPFLNAVTHNHAAGAHNHAADIVSFGWFYRGLALLVVACPCALVISTPVSIISAISNAARRGILIKGGVFLEKLSQIRAVAFDKTGTLTVGQPTVLTVRTTACDGDDHDDLQCSDASSDLLALAAAVETQSEHPLANAIVAASAERGLTNRYEPAQNVTAIMGKGVSGTVAGREIFIGSHTYFEESIPHPASHCQQAKADSAAGHTPMMVSDSGTYLGTITVADSIRPASQNIVTSLKQMGMHTVAMLTGDANATAQKVASEIGITDVRADLLPEDKVTAVADLQQQYGEIAMIGDGINDAPALASADVSIAIGGAGSTTTAMETADITLMGNSIDQLPFVLDLSRATMRTIRANVIFSIGIKLVFVVLVLAGLGTMWMAIFADVGASLLVTLYGMRLLNWKSSFTPVTELSTAPQFTSANSELATVDHAMGDVDAYAVDNETSLSVTSLSHRYATGNALNFDNAPSVLNNISFTLNAGEQLLLRGKSGSGKTTLFNILAGILTPTTGTVQLAGQPIYALSEAERDNFRRGNIGYVFQTHHLLPILNAWENVAMPLAFSGVSTAERKQRALVLLHEVGLAQFAEYRPNQLSTGQRQRVAIARALITNPRLILADEPTASLDAENGESVIELLQETCRNSNTILLVASHDPLLSERFERIIDLEYGRWIE